MRWKTSNQDIINPIDQSLLAACREGNVEQVQDCLRQGAKINCMEEGWMPLHLACTNRHEQVAMVLLEADAKPDLLAKANGLAPLSILIQSSSSSNALAVKAAGSTSRLQQQQAHRQQEKVVLRMAEALLRFGADPSGCTEIQTESSPLHMAAKQGRLGLVQLLIEYGALMIHDGQTDSLMQHPKSFMAHNNNNNNNNKIKTLTPLAMACRAGHTMVMDYLLAALPPQSLQSSFVLQQALQEARASRNVDCLVGLWEYSEDVLWLDFDKASSIDPGRHASLVQCFFEIFQKPSSPSGDNSKSNVAATPEEEDLHASFRHDSKPSPIGIGSRIDTDEPDIDTKAAASWWEVLQEACRRRSVNLMQSLLQRLPYQDILFAEIQRNQPAMRTALLQAKDRHDHQTLLHRFCSALNESVKSNHVENNNTNETELELALTWIQRLLLLSRESCDENLEGSSSHFDRMHCSFVAQYESDSKFTLETSEFSAEDTTSQPAGGGGGNFASFSSLLEGDDSIKPSNDLKEESDGSSLHISRQGITTEHSRAEQVHSLGEGDEDAEDSESEGSYSLESVTESESEDAIQSEYSWEEEETEDLNASFLAVPTHSGKDLINVGDKNRQTALHIACARGFLQAIQLLLQEDTVQVNAQDVHGNTPLMVSERLDVISCLLLDPRTDLNVTNFEGLTCLNLAIQNGDMMMVQLLLHKGASPETPDAQGRTPLYVACSEGNAEICVYLLAHGVDPNTPTLGKMDTPLHAACEAGHLGVILRLFAASVHATDACGRTPLHVACFFGHLDIVEYLITERQASLNTQDNDGLTPFELACQAGCVSVVYYLARYHTSNMWHRTPQINMYSNTYSRLALSLEEEFACSYSNISTAVYSSCYGKEDPFSVSSSIFKEIYQTSSNSHLSSSSPEEQVHLPLYNDSFPYQDEVEYPSCYRMSPYKDDIIYY